MEKWAGVLLGWRECSYSLCCLEELLRAHCWFGFIPLGVQHVTTLFMALAGGFSAFYLNIDTTVLAGPLGSSF